ncbi:MAG: hypothetical protein FWF03_04855, partial [Defluviitaleaceae bacterium]|nr:hypothetical protein [Defluviitaleaceae bacterium]
MKKVLALAIPILLTLSLFAACGEKNESESGASYGGGDDSGGAPPASNKDDSNGAGDAGSHSEQDIGFVKPSQLIPLENAKRIVHESLEYYLDKTTNEPEMDKAENPFPGFTISYGGDVFLILVVTVNYNE